MLYAGKNSNDLLVAAPVNQPKSTSLIKVMNENYLSRLLLIIFRALLVTRRSNQERSLLVGLDRDQ